MSYYRGQWSRGYHVDAGMEPPEQRNVQLLRFTSQLWEFRRTFFCMATWSVGRSIIQL